MMQLLIRRRRRRRRRRRYREFFTSCTLPLTDRYRPKAPRRLAVNPALLLSLLHYTLLIMCVAGANPKGAARRKKTSTRTTPPPLTEPKRNTTSTTSTRTTTITTEEVAPSLELEQPPMMILPQKRATTHHPVQCWAHTQKSAKRCTAFVSSREGESIPIPYCSVHLKSGDGALRVASHPFAGKCLVARYDLPAKYRIAFWGKRGKCPTSDKEDRSISFYPPHPKTGSNRCPKTGTLRSDNYNGVLNPKDTGDVIQYAACPGPTERQNMRSTFQYWGKRNGDLGGLEFITLQKVPKNTQLCHWYGSGWWSAREVKRKDVGTKDYPAPKRIKSTGTSSVQES